MLNMAKNQSSNPDNEADVVNNVASDQEEKKQHRKRKPVEKKKSKHILTCVVFSLDRTELTIEVEKNAHGEVLFGKVIENLDIVDKEYFGLRFLKSLTSSKCWLDLHKPIRKQLTVGHLEFQFAVKFYEPEPGRHLDEYTRYLLYLQLREDIVDGRLHCPIRTYVLLGSFTAQAEFGDYDPIEQGYTYLDDYQLGPQEIDAEPKFLQRVIDLHREHKGQNPAEAELNFLEVAKRNLRYGIDIHFVKNKKGEEIEIGVSHQGIILFKDSEAYDSFGWKSIDLVSYKRRKFLLKLFPSAKKKNPRFATQKKRDAKNLYKSAIEHHSFFRLTNPDPAKRRAEMFFIGSKFRYSDRTLYQIRSSPSVQERQPSKKFARSPSRKYHLKSTKQRTAPVNEDLQQPEGKPETTENQVEYEEIEIDESQPGDSTYNSEEWEIIEKVQPDGTKKRYRRRIMTTTTTTTTRSTYVIRKGTEEVGHVLEDKPITQVPAEEQVEDVEERHVSPDVEYHDKTDENSHHHEQIITTTIVTKEIITTPEKRSEVQTDENAKQMALNDLRAASKKPSAAVKPLMREDLEDEFTTTTTKTTKVLVYDADKEETVKVVSQEERERELRQREIELEEHRRREELRLREEREEILRRQREKEELLRKKQEEFEQRQFELQQEELRKKDNASPKFELITLSTGNEEFDREFGIKPETFLVKSSPMPPKILFEDDNDEFDGSMEDDRDTSIDNLVVTDTRKVKTLDRKFVRRPPPERASGYIRRSYGDELDYDYSPGQGARTMPRKMRKYVPLITKEELVRAYSQGGLNDDNITRKKAEEEQQAQIEYSLKDTSGFEQGASGFVKSLIGKHEIIKQEYSDEVEERRRSRVYSSTDEGLVPTRTASFANAEKPEVRKTKVPPPVKTKPVVFQPDDSGKSVTVQSSLDAEPGSITAEPNKPECRESNGQYPIPEVITTSIMYDAHAMPSDSQSTDEEPGIVPTKNISVVPAELAEFHPPPPDVITHSDITTTTTLSDDSDGFPSPPPPDLVTQTILAPHQTSSTLIETKHVTSSRMLPPEVETHTVVISGGGGMSDEEIKKLLGDDLFGMSSETSVTTTSVMTTQTTHHRVEQTVVSEHSSSVTQAEDDSQDH